MKIVFVGTPEECLAEMQKMALAHDALLHTIERPEVSLSDVASRDTAEPEPVAEVEAKPEPVAEVEAKPEPKKKSKRKGNPTLLDLAKVTDPDGSLAAVIEPLDETNEVLAVQAPVEAAEEPSGITDADLSKAASHAAGKITPAGVKEILAEFGVNKVQELGHEVRQQFLDDLKEAGG